MQVSLRILTSPMLITIIGVDFDMDYPPINGVGLYGLAVVVVR